MYIAKYIPSLQINVKATGVHGTDEPVHVAKFPLGVNQYIVTQ